MKKSFSCYLINETSLGIQCAEEILKEGHYLLGIISPDPKTHLWALEKGVPYLATLEEFITLNPYKTFDYLFSVVNGRILSESILQLPHYFVINYHDAPLPKYAGVHATSWAILNGELTHGISWHRVNQVVDAGNILKQVFFSIDDDETALSLNLKCYNHALDAFKDLIQELAKEPLKGKKQNIKSRSYFSRNQKPLSMGFAFWDDAAQNIERQFRALSFGNYPNTLATFKIFINNDIIIPTKLEILSSDSKNLPGTLTRITSQVFDVATKTQEIRLSHFRDGVGNLLFIKDILAHGQLNVGDILQTPPRKILKDLIELSTNLSAYENFWTKQINNISPAQLPFVSTLPKSDQSNAMVYEITDSFLEFSSNFVRRTERSVSFIEIFIAAFLTYLSRLGNSFPFTIGFVTPALKNVSQDLSFFLPPYLPITFSFASTTGFNALLDYVKDQVDLIQKNKAYCKDVYIRYPHINQSLLFLPIIIDLSPSRKEDERLNQSPLILRLDEQSKSYTLQLKGVQDSISETLLKNFLEHMRIIIAHITQYPEAILEELLLLTSAEKNQLLIEWNDTKSNYPKDKTVHQLFEEQVIKAPNNIAVVYEDHELTYQQLNEKANQLAHYLRSLGVGPDTLVAIAAERSLEMIIGLL
ncbi:MAG: AMP-binding protein, partial [Alphaproteobacteria bacterium]|nr:AMP-binding protein [Alphaproteobacteria bacterium]MBP9777400.1 AMP-binding protein [Alphaproteobacteria bacterium]